MNSLFRQQAPSSADLDSFHNDGYVYYPNVLTAEGREKLIEEILRLDDDRLPFCHRTPVGDRNLKVIPGSHLVAPTLFRYRDRAAVL